MPNFPIHLFLFLFLKCLFLRLPLLPRRRRRRQRMRCRRKARSETTLRPKRRKWSTRPRLFSFWAEPLPSFSRMTMALALFLQSVNPSLSLLGFCVHTHAQITKFVSHVDFFCFTLWWLAMRLFFVFESN